MKYLFALLMVTLMISCGGRNDQFTTVDVDGLYSIEVPDYMSKIEMNNPYASMQYGNEVLENYIVVIAESHEYLLENGIEFSIEEYAEVCLKNLKTTIQDPVLERIGDGIEIVNGMEALAYEIGGVFKENNMGIYYKAMFYRSDKSFYYVLTWTLSERKNEFDNNMGKIIYSLKEL